MSKTQRATANTPAPSTSTDRELNIVHAHLDGIDSLAGGMIGWSYDEARKKGAIMEHVSKIRRSLERLADCLPPMEISIPCDEHDWQTDADDNTYCAKCGVVCKHGRSCHCRQEYTAGVVAGGGSA